MIASGDTIDRLGLLAVAWLDGRPEEVEFAGFSDEAWALVSTHRLAGLVYELAAAATGTAAAAVAGRLRSGFYGTVLRNETHLRVAAEICTLLYQENIRAVRLKGAELLVTVYANPGQRPMDDIDILIREADVEHAVRVLLECGYRFPPGSLPLTFYRRHHFHVALISPEDVYVELHWQLLDRQRRGGLDSKSLVAHAEPLSPLEPGLGHRLDREHGFLYLALHLDKHAPYQTQLRRRAGIGAAFAHASSDVRMIWLVDLALAARDPMLDSPRLNRIARDLGVTRGLWAALSLAAVALGRARFPIDIEELAPVDSRARSWIDDRVAGLLLSRRPWFAKWMARATEFDSHAQLRPIRVLDLAYLPFGRAGGGGRFELAELWSGFRMAGSLLWHRLRRR